MQMKNDLAEEGAGYKSVEIFSANRHKRKVDIKNDNSKHK